METGNLTAKSSQLTRTSDKENVPNGSTKQKGGGETSVLAFNAYVLDGSLTYNVEPELHK